MAGNTTTDRKQENRNGAKKFANMTMHNLNIKKTKIVVVTELTRNNVFGVYHAPCFLFFNSHNPVWSQIASLY